MILRKNIGLDEARDIAEAEAKIFLSGAVQVGSQAEILSKNVAEGFGCWIFFRNKEIPILSGGELASSGAYAVSQRGEVRVVADFSEDPQKLAELLTLLSQFFGKEEQT